MNSVATTLVLIRHGETEWNREMRIQGHTDSTLTSEGILQAEACALRLATEKIDRVISSDLGRTQHTAKLLNAHQQKPIQFDAALRERCFGMAEGATYAELDIRYPGLFSKVQEVDPHYAVEGAESRAVFHQRVVGAIEYIASTHAGERVLIVTHGGVLAAIYRWLHKLPVASPHKVDIPNVGYNRIACSENQWRIEVWGDVSHLASLKL